MSDTGMNSGTSRSATPEFTPTYPISHASTTSPTRESIQFRNIPDVAICGVGLRLPGGIRSGTDLWNFLKNGNDARSPIPESRYNIQGFNESLGGKDFNKTKHGYFLEDDISKLDTSFFTMSKNELDQTDPQQRLLLEVARECLEDAGEVNYRGQSIGCYVGTFAEDWIVMSAKDSHQGGGYSVTGHPDLMIANRVSYEYDLRGPSMVLKTGCSSSLLGLHEAVRAIHGGDATAAIVAGTNLITTPTLSIIQDAGEILSPDGSCKTFDASANGYARGEAITAVYIKRLDDALRDGNPVRAIVRGTATNCDGRGNSLVTPNGIAQEGLMRKVYENAGLDPQHTSFVECHGTGTPTGDPIETTAVGKVFGEQGVYIGSIKPNLGHSEGSAGISSLIKAVLALEQQSIPPNIKFENPNPKIPFSEYKLKVPTVLTPIPIDRAERISINSFGIGGSNVHAIIDSYRQRDGIFDKEITNEAEKVKKLEYTSMPQLLLLSANTEWSLGEQSRLHQEWICENPDSVADMVYTRALHREHLPHRSFSIIQKGEVIKSGPGLISPKDPQQVILVFSGQGAQWPGMANELIHNDPAFHSDLLQMNRKLESLAHPPTWDLLDELLKPKESSQVNKAQLSQPLCTAIQVALYNKFQNMGIDPVAVVGHSSGEIAAAYASGYLTMDEAITIAYYRGYVADKQTLAGAMAAVGMGSEELSQYLTDGVVVACENSPESSTISGDLEKVNRFIDMLNETKPDVFSRALKVDVAYHSYHMELLSKEYEQLLEGEIEISQNRKNQSNATFYSSVTTNSVDNPSDLGPRYWTENLKSPVRFSSTVSRLLSEQQDGIFMEIGPHSALAGPLRQIFTAESKPREYISVLTRFKDSLACYLTSIGHLYQRNVTLDLRHVYPHGKAISGLPTYPWDHSTSYWRESRLSSSWRNRKYPHHCLLGSMVVESSETEPQWRNMLHLEDEPWLSDHKVQDNVVFPFAGYVALAGEALRQITHSSHADGYRLRDVVALTALLLSDSSPTELITSLRRHTPTGNEESVWYDFSVASFHNSVWVRHCEGQVSLITSPRSVDWTPLSLPRVVNCTQFYGRLSNVGFVFGPEFRGLRDVTTSVSKECAMGQVVNRSPKLRSPFTLHPCAIDAFLQLLLIAKAKGAPRNLVQLAVPKGIKQIEVCPGGDLIDARVWQPYDNPKLSRVEGAINGSLVLHASGIELHPIEDISTGDTTDVHACARLQWLPDFDFVDLSTLFIPPKPNRVETRQQEELGLLGIIEMAERVRYLHPCQPHFAKLRDWLNQRIGVALAGKHKLVDDSERYVELPRNERQAMIESQISSLSHGSRKSFAIGLCRILNNAEAIFSGKVETLDLLMQDNILASIYDTITFDYSRFVRLLSHTRPNIRILEVGAGTGGTTQTILSAMADECGLSPYSTYSFTDISAGFFPTAKERFGNCSNMEFKVLDISKNPIEQGFLAGSYDLILGANVIHATPSLKDSLRNIRQLLKPDGLLVMTEICSLTPSTNLMFGNFSGWWLGEEDGRPYQPYVSVSRWDKDLRAAGFSGVDTTVYDEEEPYRYCAVMVARNQAPALSRQMPNITVLAESSKSEVAKKVVSAFPESISQIVELSNINADLPMDHDIISCLDLESNFFEDISEERFESFKRFIGSLGDRKLLWLTSPTQMKCQDPRSSQSIGVARTIRSELGHSFSTLEIDPREADFKCLISKVFQKISSDDDKEDFLDSEKEFIVDDGVIHVGRYHPFSVTEEVQVKSNGGHNAFVRTLDIEHTGMLDSLTWRSSPIPESIPENHVEIKVSSCGMNNRDLLHITSQRPLDQGNGPLGFEVSGVITRLGSEVKGLVIGDRILSFINQGQGFATHVVVPSELVLKIPDSMDFPEAVTIPICFSTAMYALLDAGRLQNGMSVLIHSACTGVGLAAIQVVKMIGGDLYVTVSDQAQREYLVANYDIPQTRIFSSKDRSFFDGVMEESQGRGVELVLNNLSGDLLDATWECVAMSGALIEIGDGNITNSGGLDLSRFLENRSYSKIDVGNLIQNRPQVVRDLLKQIMENCMQGLLRPLSSINSFDAVDVKDAFRNLQSGTQIGKTILNMPDDANTLAASLKPQPLQFKQDSAYLLVGGMGGLGTSLAIWLVERGARNLVFLSRGAGTSTQSTNLSRELEAMGCSVTLVPGSVNEPSDVEEAIKLCPVRISGVFHLAMTQRDSPFLDMKWTDWVDANDTKVMGTWNLHQAFLHHDLDYFWLASSTVTVVDQPGQGNYKAGCMFTEAFTQYRHSLGLPASVICISPIHDVGYVAENPWALRNLKMQGLYMLGEQEFLDSVEASLLNSSPTDTKSGEETKNAMDPAVSKELKPWVHNAQFVMGLKSELHLNDPKNTTNWRRDRRMGMYHNLPMKEVSQKGLEDSHLKRFQDELAGMDATAATLLLEETSTVDLITHETGRKIYDFLLKPADMDIDFELSLIQMGLDSLTAIELRRWVRKALGLQISVLEIMESVSLRQLGETLAGKLKQQHGA